MKGKKAVLMSYLLVIMFCLFVPARAGANGSAETSMEADAPIEIYWMDQYKEAWVDSVILEKFNVKIVSNEVYVNDRERVNVMMAAGEFPDVGPLLSSFDSLELYQDGVVRAIPKTMIEKYAPKYTKILSQYPMGWLANSNPENPEEMLALNGISATTDTNIFMPMFRVDWVRNVGIELPEYDSKKFPIDRFNRCFFLDEDFTLDWYEKLLVAFRDGDPDGNGKVDTIPYGAMNNIGRSWRSLMGSFGVLYEENRLVDGELTHMFIDPGMKDFLSRMAKWYQMGLIDNEFITLERNSFYDKVASGVIGTTTEQATYAGQGYAMNRTPNAFVKEEELGNPGAEVCIIPPLVGPKGDQGAVAYRAVEPDGSYKWFVNAKVDDAKLAKILEVFDYFRGDDEGYIYWQFGKPDVHFDWEGEAWQSTPIARTQEQIPDGYPEQGPRNGYPPMITKDRMKFFNPKDLNVFYINYLMAPRGQEHALRPHRLDILNETKYTEVRTKYWDTMETLFEEFFYKAITGVLDVDAEWDDYVATQRKNGMDLMLAELQNAPLVSELRKGSIKY